MEKRESLMSNHANDQGEKTGDVLPNGREVLKGVGKIESDFSLRSARHSIRRARRTKDSQGHGCPHPNFGHMRVRLRLVAVSGHSEDHRAHAYGTLVLRNSRGGRK